MRSSNFLLYDSSDSNGGLLSASEIPSERTNLWIASGSIPLFLSAVKVGSRGSSQPETKPPWIRGFSFLLDTGIPSNSKRENSTAMACEGPMI